MKIKKAVIHSAMRLFRLMGGVKKNTVLIESFNGKAYSDNPRAVSEILQSLEPNLDIVWALSDPSSKKGVLPQGIRVIDRNSKWSYYKTLATCGCFVTNFVLPMVPKSKKQYFVQTWHGDRGFKKILLDARSTFVPEQVDGYCDLAITGSKYGEMQFSSAFHYTGEVLKTGTPRNDCLIEKNADTISALRASLNVGENTKILLYAPTLRDKAYYNKEKQGIQDVDLLRTLSCLERKYGMDWICFVRAHPSMLGLSGMEKTDKIVDVSSYEDMGDLLLISDMLITDYSSSAGDFALLDRPIILFQSDKKEYIENSRELYFDMNSTPYYIAERQEELEELIERLSDDSIKENCKAVLDFYGTYESGKASENVAKKIIEHLEKI